MRVTESLLVSSMALVTSLPRLPVVPTMATVLMVAGDDILGCSVGKRALGWDLPLMNEAGMCNRECQQTLCTVHAGSHEVVVRSGDMTFPFSLHVRCVRVYVFAEESCIERRNRSKELVECNKYLVIDSLYGVLVSQ